MKKSRIPTEYHPMGASLIVGSGQRWRFSCYAPSCRAASVVGDFNGWSPTAAPMERSADGTWSTVISGLSKGSSYKFCFTAADGSLLYRADPFARYAEVRPGTASRLWRDSFSWSDGGYMSRRAASGGPMLIYEVHAGSWKAVAGYRQLADELAPYAKEQGYTHVELMPLNEYPFDGSWGYQTLGYFAPTSRYGTPSDFKYLIDKFHAFGLGVILDWVPAHFPRDEHGLRRFDGEPLFENDDERIAEHRQWGTLRFDFDKPFTRRFLISSALYMLETFHLDGLRLDAVSTIIYTDYGRDFSLLNENGDNHDAGGIAFLRELNSAVSAAFPGVIMAAEEATDFRGVTAPISAGGLGFSYKWNMGWMNDTLRYMQTDPLYRGSVHNLMTFSMLYAFNERFILPLSHDECVHGKLSLIDKMFGGYYDKFAAYKAYLVYMFTHPGAKLLFMGWEFGQFLEWRYYEPLEWQLVESNDNHRRQALFSSELMAFYRGHSALWQDDTSWDGFLWSNPDDAVFEVLSYFRLCKSEKLLVVLNLTPAARENYFVGTPFDGKYELLFSSADPRYSASPSWALPAFEQTVPEKQGRFDNRLVLNLPPYAALIYRPAPSKPKRSGRKKL